MKVTVKERSIEIEGDELNQEQKSMIIKELETRRAKIEQQWFEESLFQGSRLAKPSR